MLNISLEFDNNLHKQSKTFEPLKKEHFKIVHFSMNVYLRSRMHFEIITGETTFGTLP